MRVLDREREALQMRAFHNVAANVSPGLGLPKQVFATGWTEFFFFQSEWVLHSDFVEIARQLLDIERANLWCAVNYDETKSFDYQSAVARYFDRETVEGSYRAEIEFPDGMPGWLNTLGCASDIGEWCTHCNPIEEIAIIAFRDAQRADRYRKQLERLCAQPVEVKLSDPEAAFPFGMDEGKWHMVEKFRMALLGNYGPAARASASLEAPGSPLSRG